MQDLHNVDRFTPRQIESKILGEFPDNNGGGLNCLDRAMAAIDLAQAFGYRAYLVRTHWHAWVMIYTDDGPVEILRTRLVDF